MLEDYEANPTPTARVIGLRYSVAKKQYRCAECGETINPGARYKRLRVVVGWGRRDTRRICDMCLYMEGE